MASGSPSCTCLSCLGCPSTCGWPPHVPSGSGPCKTRGGRGSGSDAGLPLARAAWLPLACVCFLCWEFRGANKPSRPGAGSRTQRPPRSSTGGSGSSLAGVRPSCPSPCGKVEWSVSRPCTRGQRRDLLWRTAEGFSGRDSQVPVAWPRCTSKICRNPGLLGGPALPLPSTGATHPLARPFPRVSTHSSGPRKPLTLGPPECYVTGEEFVPERFQSCTHGSERLCEER